MKAEFLNNEYWYGGVVHLGDRLPISEEDDIKIDMVGGDLACDQYSPLFLSSKGRYLHSKHAFNIHFFNGKILIDDCYDTELSEGHENLKGAQLAAARNYFELFGKIPNLKFFKSPQYNTWIELMYNQNQKQILEYAHSLKEGGMPSGVLIIDEGWAPDYGIYDFAVDKFEDPKAMIDELHSMGFSVMLWVTPLISPDSNRYREIRNTDLLIKDKNGKAVVREWWNGFSCVLDFSNADTCTWFRKQLQWLMGKYGVDGFKFDSGDTYLYRSDDKTNICQDTNEHTKSFNAFCGEFEFNELRNVWDCGGKPLICRLQDKAPNWDERGLMALLPNMLTQGILGYYFGCPDMVGGGAYGAFLQEDYCTDEELYLRWLGVSALCPMMQFSISPKRILTSKGFEMVQKLCALRNKYVDTIIELANNAVHIGEPILRYMEYEFPNCGYEKITDQFMLGSDILVSPILKQGMKERTIMVPMGKWKTQDGTETEGPCKITVKAELNELPILIREQ